MKDVLAVGHFTDSGDFVVEAVLTARLPALTSEQWAEISWRIDQWASQYPSNQPLPQQKGLLG